MIFFTVFSVKKQTKNMWFLRQKTRKKNNEKMFFSKRFCL